jgi:acetyl-CoA carboxylase carboxyltransferase component
MDQDRRITRGPDYHWITIEPGQHRFLNPVFAGFGFGSLQLWIDADVPANRFERSHCQGLVTAAGEFRGRPVAIAWSDFRVNAAAFGHDNSKRFSAFLSHLGRPGAGRIPLIYCVNSAGVSLMEGRRVFADGFALWPDLLAYSEHSPLFTCAIGKCLGLAPLLFGLGHYRVAVAAQTQVNLAGPEVIRMFFGEKIDFTERAAAERFHERNDLVQELVPSVDAAFARFRGLLTGRAATDAAPPASLGQRSAALLLPFAKETLQEVIPGWCDRVRLFLGTRNGTRVGIFLNPLERSNNMVTVRTLEKYAAGLDLFRALRVPIVSFLDSPGVDPRFDQSDANNLRKMLWVGEKIIHYPHGAMGVVAGRCFGGSATLAFPKVFGGFRSIAIRGSRFGAMHESIISRLLGGSPRLLRQWNEVAARQGPGLEDLLSAGSLDAVIDPAELPREIDRFLAQCRAGRRREISAPRLSVEATLRPRAGWPPQAEWLRKAAL